MKTKKTMNTIKEIQNLISYGINSLKIHKIIIEESDGLKQIRPSIHIILQAATGSMKSTILGFIKEACNAVEADDMTLPGMIGTIEKMMLVPGFAWTGRNKLMLFDEFTFGRKRADTVMFLKLLEDQFYAKKFGRFIPNREPERDDDLYYAVRNGSIELKTRFSAVIATMRQFEHSRRSSNLTAFMNRTIPYRFKFNLDEMDWLLEKTKLFKPKQYKTKEKHHVKWKDYKKIKKCIYNYLDKSKYNEDVKEQNFARLVGDVIRIFCITGKFSKKEIHKICEFKLSTYSRIGIHYKDKWR